MLCSSFFLPTMFLPPPGTSRQASVTLPGQDISGPFAWRHRGVATVARCLRLNKLSELLHAAIVLARSVSAAIFMIYVLALMPPATILFELFPRRAIYAPHARGAQRRSGHFFFRVLDLPTACDATGAFTVAGFS
ncbi:hypothetical protein B0H10DRAFT_2083576 [Mycena sp. CBHHK59/15]|nr:hypothetical protein B0H10DRAFT_2083576 [Mycena sp. CBHHK59/15]